MNKPAPEGAAAGELFAKNMMRAFLQIGSVVLLIWMCYSIIAPFMSLVAWGLIIAVAVHPTHVRLTALLGGHQGRSATLLVMLGLLLLALPVWLSLDNGIDSARQVATGLRDGTLAIPAPRDSVADWPLVGERIHALWSAASENLQETLRQFDAQLARVGETVLRNLGSGVLGVLEFLASIIVAGFFLVSGAGGYRLAIAIAISISPHRGPELVNVAIDTIRSVTKGVLGVAVVQALLALIGLVAVAVPGAGIWAVIVLVLAVLQLPPWIVLVPVSIWVFSVSDLVPASAFLVYSMIVSASDLVLKPWLLGRGVNLPMPVILVGAIGGAFSMGVIGLFVGAVTLAIAHELIQAWIYPEQAADEPDSGEGPDVAGQAGSVVDGTERDHS